MLIDGNPQDTKKAIEWVRSMKQQALRNRIKFQEQDGKLHSGYSEDVSHNLELCNTRRQINREQKTGEIAALASFSKVAIRMYANRIGVPVAEMYRNPELLKRMVKDRDYARFRLNDNAANML